MRHCAKQQILVGLAEVAGECRCDARGHQPGEARVVGKTHTVAQYLLDVRRHIVGHDPHDIEALYRRLTLLDFGSAGEVVMTGLALIEMACWDIIGKQAKLPVYQMLGGKVRDKIPAYANGWYTVERTPDNFAAAATVYRMFLFFSITLYVMSKLFGIGLVLAIWTAAAWFLLPSGKFIHYLTANPQLHDRRQRAVFVSLAILAAAVIGLGMIPAPDRRHATGVVEADAGFMAGVFARTTGFVEQCHVREGEIVAKGEPVLTLASAELTRAIDMGIAQRDELESRLRDTQTKSPAAAVRLAEQLALVEHQVEFLRERERALIITAPISGRVLTDPSLLVGSYVREGQEVCQVLDPLRVHVNASLSTVEARPLLELQSRGETYKVEFRRYADVARSVEGVDPVVLPGTRLLAHPAMTFAGGGQVEPQQGDESGMVAKRPRFPMIVRAPEGATVGVPGERVAIRVTLSPRPLAAQWIDRVRRIFQGLVDI